MCAKSQIISCIWIQNSCLPSLYDMQRDWGRSSLFINWLYSESLPGHVRIHQACQHHRCFNGAHPLLSPGLWRGQCTHYWFTIHKGGVEKHPIVRFIRTTANDNPRQTTSNLSEGATRLARWRLGRNRVEKGECLTFVPSSGSELIVLLLPQANRRSRLSLF